MSQIYAQLDPTVRFETSYQAQKGVGASQMAAAALVVIWGVAALAFARQGLGSPMLRLSAAATAVSLIAFALTRRTSAVWTCLLVLDLAVLTGLAALPSLPRHPAIALAPVFALLTAVRGFRASLALQRLARAD